MMVSRAIKRFEETGSNDDRTGRGRKKTARSKRNILRAKGMIHQNPTTKANSTRKLARKLEVHQKQTWQILREDLGLKPYNTASSSDYNFSDNRSSFSQAYFQKEACNEPICSPNLQYNHSTIQKELCPNDNLNHKQASPNDANLQTRDSDSSSSIESKEKRKRGRPIKEKYKNVPVRELNELKRKDNKESALKYRQRVREERNEVKKLKEENSILT
uniref:BZIP domain-containing protein n=1 Tax=Acrobeloides nanus TaxID=290746 RepID=A0A914DF28_9BILA